MYLHVYSILIILKIDKDYMYWYLDPPTPFLVPKGTLGDVVTPELKQAPPILATQVNGIYQISCETRARIVRVRPLGFLPSAYHGD